MMGEVGTELLCQWHNVGAVQVQPWLRKVSARKETAFLRKQQLWFC